MPRPSHSNAQAHHLTPVGATSPHCLPACTRRRSKESRKETTAQRESAAANLMEQLDTTYLSDASADVACTDVGSRITGECSASDEKPTMDPDEMAAGEVVHVMDAAVFPLPRRDEEPQQRAEKPLDALAGEADGGLVGESPVVGGAVGAEVLTAYVEWVNERAPRTRRHADPVEGLPSPSLKRRLRRKRR